MNKIELLKKLNDIEWQDFEVKEASSSLPKSCWETVSAFANTNGGWLVLGIRQNKKNYDITGIANPEKIEQDFLTVMRGEKFNQKLKLKTFKYDFDGKYVLAFYIPESDSKPLYFNSRKNSFIRSGSGDQRATDYEIDAMYRNSAYGAKDKELTDYTFDDLDMNTIRVYRDYLKSYNPEHRYNKYSDIELLEKLQVIKDNKITVGGLLFFGKQDDIAQLLTDFRIDYFEVPGISYSDSPVRYSYRLSEEENLFMFYFAIIERLTKKIDLPFKMQQNGFATDNQPQLVAIREALVNLLMHSDYFSTMKPRIRVFSNRIEFMNPGGLPKDITSIMKEDFSKPRNPIIARIFRAIKLAENAGSGFDKMFSGWKSYYNKLPVVTGDFSYYKIEFPFSEPVSEPVSESVSEPVSESVSESVSEPVKLDDNLKAMLVLLNKNPYSTNNDLALAMNKSRATITRYIRELKNLELIERNGADKNGYWKIKTKQL